MNAYLFLHILLVSTAATTAMTLFSYAVSATFRELYKEPVLLTYLFIKMNLDLSIKAKMILGWLTHYAIGFLFVLAYHIIWIRHYLEISILHTLLLGAISGIIGIGSWVIMFKISHHQPSIDFKGYYIQLFFAHIVFAVVAALIYHISLTVSLLVNAYVSI